MRRWRTRACFALAIPLAVLGLPASGSPLPVSASWAEEPIWDDGLAEVAAYEASREIYGAHRPYEAFLITVKEELDPRTLVKADPPYAGRTLLGVIKQNAVREIPTPNYDYRIMTSTFVERRNPTALVKLTSGSHEWCGNTWKAVRQREGRTVYDWASYFEGEADGRQELDLDLGDLVEDQLPVALRGLDFRAGLEFEARLLPSFANIHAGPVRWTEASFRVVRRETLELPAGTVESWRVEVRHGERRTVWWFDTAGTHPLVQMEGPAGELLRLKHIERRSYWVLPRHPDAAHSPPSSNAR